MNTLLLHPTDVLFFRDGRPMSGASAGHGAAWPLPTVTDAALHAALHRSSIQGYKHDHRRGADRAGKDVRPFGSLVTAGPFPVSPDDTWYFPRPLDLTHASLTPRLHPAEFTGVSNLPLPLRYAVANSEAPSKDSGAKPWLSRAAFDAYLAGGSKALTDADALADADFCDAEATIGIGIDAATGAQDGASFYSAHYLRLRDRWRLGILAKTNEKVNDDGASRADLIPALIQTSGHIIIGGQQRICTAKLESGPLPLPRGMTSGFQERGGRILVKWVLHSPAIWPRIAAQDDRGIPEHTGGWLPNWVRQSDGKVMLRSGERQRRTYNGKHARGFGESTEINAHLVAALTPKPIVVTGWAVADDGAERAEGGAKPTHLAVPAGAVYYFEAANETEARKLADALNWHGDSAGTTIKNRRSTLLGEKGFGLGACGTWQLHGEPQPRT